MVDSLKIVIVEDEPISTAYLKKLIKDTAKPHSIVAEIDSVNDALPFFSTVEDFDLVFMDIHLGDGTCFEILNAVQIKKPIVFCTTFDTYAIDAFNYNSLDYILKPPKLEDIQDALNKYWSLKAIERQNYVQRTGQMVNSFTPPSYKKRFLVRNDNRITLIETKNIFCFYSDNSSTYLVENCGAKHLVEYTLDKLEGLLHPEYFFRINRKVTISIDVIQSVKDYPNHRLFIELENDLDLDLVVSRNRVKDFKNWLKGIA